MSRRGHGEGSIYRRKDGRWTASITLEDRKRKTFYGKTRKEVQELLKNALHQQQVGALATGPQQTVKQYLEQWLEQVHKPAIRLSSYIKYRGLLDRDILPALGHLRLQKLTPQHVQALYARKLEEGLTARTIHSIHSLLHKALDTAVHWDLVSRNVCDLVSQPRPCQHEIRPLNKDQAMQLLKAAREHRLEALLTLAVATGMRRGELLSLRWQDINLADACLHVRHTMNRILGHGIVESEPKTPQGKRKIMLPQFAVEALKEQRTRQQEARLQAGSAWRDQDLVFSNIYGGYLDPGNTLRIFHKLVEEAGLPHLRFHDLRHSAATILLGMGVHPKVVQELLGHSKIGITMDIYSHILPSMQQEAMGKMQDAFEEAP